MKRGLVVGGSGFVGTSLVPLLADHGFDLTVLDPLPPQSRLSNVSYICADTPIGSADANGFEFAICLAGATSVDGALDQPHSAVAKNIAIANDLGEWARANPAIFILYMSSDEVLGESTVPLPEDAVRRPTQPYAASKAAAELIVANYATVYGFPHAVIRSCNLVGINQRFPKLVPVSAHSLRAETPVPIHGSGLQRREWMHVSDICSGICAIVSQRAVGVFHATTGVSLTVLDVVSRLSDILALPLRIKHVPDRLVQDQSYAMSCDRLYALGWQPAIGIDDALRKAVLGCDASQDESRR